jgi:multidrug resistance protein, MATE family
MGSLSRWWNEPAGPKEVLALAWPLMLSTGLFSLTLFVDRMMLYWHSDASASAAMSAGSLFWAIICAPVGMIGYTGTFVAQYYGVKRTDRGIAVVWQGLLLSLALGPLFLLGAIFSSYIFQFAGHPPSLVKVEAEYFRWLMPGAWATVAGSALTGLFAGMGKTRVILACDFTATILNATLDALLIFGLLGFPRLGVIGAAIASSVSLITKVVIIGWMTYRFYTKFRNPLPAESLKDDREQKHGLLSVDWPLMKRLIRFGWPAGIQMLAESLSFTFIMLLVAILGERAMAATTLALGVNIIAFIPMTGLGMAVGVLVGQHLTAGEPLLARRVVRSGLLISLFYTFGFVVMYGGFPDWVIQIYSFGAEPERFNEMRPLLKPLLYFIAGYCVFDSLQIVFVGALKGAGDTHFVFIASVLIGLFIVILGKIGADYLFPDIGKNSNAEMVQANEKALFWWWGVISVWVLAMAVVFSTRYLQGKWLKMRVIESGFEPI